MGVVEVFQRPTSGPASQRGYLRFMSQMCAIASEYLKGRQLQQLSDKQSLFARADQFARAVHESLDPTTTAFTIANEGRRLIGCDRVSVALKRGNRCVIEAVSGQDTMDSRANTVTLLGTLATAVVRNGETLWYTGPSDDLPPQIEGAVQEYVDECHSKSVAVIPLFKPKDPDHDVELAERKDRKDPECVAALVVEQIEDSRPREEFAQSLELVTEHGSRALANAAEHNSLFLMPLWRKLGKAKWLVQARTLPKTVLAAGAALIALLMMCIFPWTFAVEGTAQVRPTIWRDISADVNGTVTHVLVKQNEAVKAGQPLLKLRNVELGIRLEELRGKQQEANEQMVAASRAMVTNRNMSSTERAQARQKYSTDIAVLKQQLATLQSQLDLLHEQEKGLTVLSPIDGVVVTTWNVLEQLEQRSVSQGQILVTVANPDSEWELELFMPEKYMGHVAVAASRAAEENRDLEVRYVMSNEPENKHDGTVKVIAANAELHEEYGHSVPIRVKIAKADLKDPRIGIEATAKVICGTRPVGYVWFHELLEFVQSRVLF